MQIILINHYELLNSSSSAHIGICVNCAACLPVMAQLRTAQVPPDLLDAVKAATLHRK